MATDAILHRKLEERIGEDLRKFKAVQAEFTELLSRTAAELSEELNIERETVLHSVTRLMNDEPPIHGKPKLTVI